MLSRYVAQVLSENLWDSSSFSNYCCYHFCFHIPRAFNFYYKVLHFRNSSASFLITFLSPEIVKSIYIHIPFSLSWTMISSLLLAMVLSVYTSWFHNKFTILSRLVLTVFNTWSYHCSLFDFTPVSYSMALQFVTGLFLLLSFLNIAYLYQILGDAFYTVLMYL